MKVCHSVIIYCNLTGHALHGEIITGYVCVNLWYLCNFCGTSHQRLGILSNLTTAKITKSPIFQAVK